MIYLIKIILNLLTLTLLSKFNWYPDCLINSLLSSIKSSNAFIIKLSQWVCTRYDTLEDRNLSKFYELFDNNTYHSLEYSQKILRQDFPNFANEIEIKDTLASGSIAQVYHGSFQGEEVAIKILHPDVLKDIQNTKFVLQLFLKVLYKLRICENITSYIDFDEFWDMFWKQTDLSKEAENCKKFREYFENSSVLTIPEVYTYSKNCIIMSYHHGKSLHEVESSYERYKSITCLIIFFVMCSKMFGMLHGDLHKGNWKIVTTQKGNFERLIIYDFGICHSIDVNNFGTFLNHYDNCKWDKVIQMCMRMWSTTSIDENIESSITENYVKYMKSQVLPMKSNNIMSYLIKTLQNYNLSVRPDILNALIAFTNIEKFVYDNTDTRDEQKKGDENLKCRASTLKSHISFCKAYQCFPDYLEYCLEEYSDLEKPDFFGKFKNYSADLDKFYS
tara:strand:+ start:2138 stop:3475 length:1338 start_codon:yes stop_codon:yes gene_type:complete